MKVRASSSSSSCSRRRRALCARQQHEPAAHQPRQARPGRIYARKDLVAQAIPAQAAIFLIAVGNSQSITAAICAPIFARLCARCSQTLDADNGNRRIVAASGSTNPRRSGDGVTDDRMWADIFKIGVVIAVVTLLTMDMLQRTLRTSSAFAHAFPNPWRLAVGCCSVFEAVAGRGRTLARPEHCL
jgi:hypothetical protein